MNRIKRLRLAAKLSQQELADLVGVNQTAVSQWERDATAPRYSQIKKLADIFHVTDIYLMGLGEEEQAKKEPPTPEGMSGLTPKQLKILEMMDQMTPAQQDEMVRQAEYQLWQQQHDKGDR